MSERETKEAWAVMVNTDLTEGRGRHYVKHICELEATAIRLASGANVQGSNGQVSRVTLELRSGRWLGPVDVGQPSAEDQRMQLVIDARRDAEQRARDLGLSDAEIAALRK